MLKLRLCLRRAERRLDRKRCCHLWDDDDDVVRAVRRESFGKRVVRPGFVERRRNRRDAGRRWRRRRRAGEAAAVAASPAPRRRRRDGERRRKLRTGLRTGTCRCVQPPPLVLSYIICSILTRTYQNMCLLSFYSYKFYHLIVGAPRLVAIIKLIVLQL